MKKCTKCDIVFNSEERSRCLYCNGVLLLVHQAESARHEDNISLEGFTADESVILKVIHDRCEVAQDRKFYIVGCYFRTQTLMFMYGFSRNEMKRGRDYRRFLIQPLNMTSFLIIPWVILGFLDSLFIRIIHNAYCDQCGWKYTKISGRGGHDPQACAYNQEYSAIMRDILSGKITHSEEEFRKASVEKMVKGEPSAYRDLCLTRRSLWGVLDVACVWFSISLVILVFILFGKFIIGLSFKFFRKSDVISPLYLR